MAMRFNPVTGEYEGDIMPAGTEYQMADPYSVMGGFENPAPVQMPGSIPGYQAMPNPGNVYPHEEPTPQYNTIDPTRALWAGTLQDIGAYIASPFTYQFQGLGAKFMNAAEQSNRQIQQIRNRDKLGKQQIAQNERTLNREFNPYAEFPQAEQGYRAFADSSGLDPMDLKTREAYAEYLRSTGVGFGGQVPAKIQQAEFLSQAMYGKPFNELDEQTAREVYSRANQAYNPREQFMYGNFDPYAYENQAGYGKQVGKLSADQLLDISTGIGAAQAGLRDLKRLRDQIQEGINTGRVGQYAALWDEEMQRLNATMQDGLFSKVGALRAGGITFGAMTEGEWARLARSVADISNKPEANLKIVNDQIIKMEDDLMRAMGKYQRFQPGRLVTPNMDPSASEAYPSAGAGVEYLGDD